RVVHEDLVDLAGGDLLAAPVDDLLQAPGEGDVAVLVHDALVAGAEPAVHEGLAVGLGVVLVAGHDVGAADGDLAGDAGGLRRAGLVEAAGLRTAGAPHRARPST